MKPVITDKYEMSYIRKMGNPKTHKTEDVYKRQVFTIVNKGSVLGKQNKYA